MLRAVSKPVVRVVQSVHEGELVLELTDHYCRLRPLGSRRGGPAEIEVPWGAVYLRAMQDRADATRRAKRKERV